MNHFSMVGNLGHLPELKTTNGGHITELSIYCWNGKKNVRFECVAFNQRADFICKGAHKGDTVAVGGAIDVDEWQDKTTGKPRKKVKFIVNEYRNLGQRQVGDAHA